MSGCGLTTGSGAHHISAGLGPSLIVIVMNITVNFCSEPAVMCLYHCWVVHPAVVDHPHHYRLAFVDVDSDSDGASDSAGSACQIWCSEA